MAEQRTLDAERADFEAWHRSKFATKHSTGQPTRDMHNGVYAEKYGPEREQLMWEAWQAARRAPPALDAEGLPALPEPFCKVGTGASGMWAERSADGGEPVYTAEQVRQAQRDAVAADRRSRVSADQWASLDAARVQLEAAKVERENRVARQSAPEGAPVAWITYETLDGKQKLDMGTVASNIEYTKAHKSWKWLPLYLAAPTSASAQPEVSVTNYGNPVDKINMAQAGVGERAHGYVAGWNDCVDEHSRVSAQPADQNKMENNDE